MSEMRSCFCLLLSETKDRCFNRFTKWKWINLPLSSLYGYSEGSALWFADWGAETLFWLHNKMFVCVSAQRKCFNFESLKRFFLKEEKCLQKRSDVIFFLSEWVTIWQPCQIIAQSWLLELFSRLSKDILWMNDSVVYCDEFVARLRKYFWQQLRL